MSLKLQQKCSNWNRCKNEDEDENQNLVHTKENNFSWFFILLFLVNDVNVTQEHLHLNIHGDFQMSSDILHLNCNKIFFFNYSSRFLSNDIDNNTQVY